MNALIPVRMQRNGVISGGHSERLAEVSGSSGLFSSPLPCSASRLEQLASDTIRVSARRADLLGTLLQASDPTVAIGAPEWRPVWASEALHRAYSLARLVARLDAAQPMPGRLVAMLEARLARDLADAYDQLAITDRRPLPCSPLLRSVVRNLVELFGSTVGGISLTTTVEHLSLPLLSRRAVVLAANEMTINALLHAFINRSGGELSIALTANDTGCVRLIATDSGIGTHGRRAGACGSILADFAEALDGCLTSATTRMGGTRTELAFIP